MRAAGAGRRQQRVPGPHESRYGTLVGRGQDGRPGPAAQLDRGTGGRGGAVRLRVTVLDAPPVCRRTRCTVSPGPRTAAATFSTSPRTGSRTDRACGPTSHRPPFSRRHGEAAKGLSLSSSNSDPNHSARPVNQPSRAACSVIHASIAVWKRAVKKTTEAT